MSRKRNRLKQPLSYERLYNFIYYLIDSLLFYAPDKDKITYEIIRVNKTVIVRGWYSFMNIPSGVFSYTFHIGSTHLANITAIQIKQQLIGVIYSNKGTSLSNNEQQFLLDNLPYIMSVYYQRQYMGKPKFLTSIRYKFSGDNLDRLNSIILLEEIAETNR